MAPLPHNNTALYYVDYATGSIEHTFEVRYNGAVSPVALGTSIDNFLNAVSELTCALTVNRVRSQAEGSIFSFPVTTGIEGNVYGTGAGAPDQFASSLNFVGRSPGGRRVKLSVFGFDQSFGDFRLTTGDSIPVDDAVTVLQTAAGLYLAIDGLDPVWYPYANVSVNAYWQRNLRA